MESLAPVFARLLADIDAGRFEVALDDLRQWRSQYGGDVRTLEIPADRTASPRNDARWWSAWAIVALARQNQEAERLADWALEDDCRLGFAHYLRARALWNQRRQRAETALETAIELDEALAQGFVDPRVFHLQLDLALAREDFASAAAIAHTALQTDPTDPKSRRVRTEALVHLNQAEMANAELDALEPELRDQPEIAHTCAWAALRCHRFAVAEQALATGLARAPGHPALLELQHFQTRYIWHRLLILKDQWLARLGTRGRKFERLAATLPLLIAVSGCLVVFFLLIHDESQTPRTVAGWTALATALLLVPGAIIGSRSATYWRRCLWSPRSRAWTRQTRELVAAGVLATGALLVNLVGGQGLLLTIWAILVGASGWSPGWSLAQGWRLGVARTLCGLGWAALALAVVPVYAGVVHPLTGFEPMLLGLSANLLAGGLLLASAAPGSLLLAAALSASVILAYLAGIWLGVGAAWWEYLGLAATATVVSGLALLLVCNLFIHSPERAA